MTITLNKELEQLVKRQAAEAGYEDVERYVYDRLADKSSDVDAREKTDLDPAEVERRRRVRASIQRLRGSWKSELTFEDIAAETRSEVY